MDCDVLNFNIVRNPTDPIQQFAWLESVLRQAEKDSEVAYIIGHIPPGDSTYTSECSKRYNALIDRFSDIVRGQFYGHTHYDEFRTVHEYFNYTNIAGLIHIAPSLTTYTDKSPQFRIYDVDDTSKVILDYTQYFMNISKANADPDNTPTWEVLYNAKQYFGMENMLDYSRFVNVTQELISNSTNVTSIMYNFFGVGKDYEKNKDNKKFGKYLGCRFEKDVFDDYFKCIGYRSWDPTELTNYFLEMLSGSWYKKFHDLS